MFFLFSFQVNGYELITSKSITQKNSTKKILIGSNNNHEEYSLKRKYTNKSSCNNNSYDEFINKTGYLYGVDPQFIKAIIASESCFKVDAVSHKGAQGLMQLMPFTARRFGVVDSFNAKQNIIGGVKYLKFLQNRFNNIPELVAASYNAGEGAVDKYRGIPPYKETVNYVKKVMRLYNRSIASAKPKIDSLFGGSNKISTKCKTTHNKNRHTYVEVNRNSVRGYFYGSRTDDLLAVSRKTGVLLETLKHLNKNTESREETLYEERKILLWHCNIE